MEITSNSLQELINIINKRAESKAKADIKILIDAINKSGLTNIQGFYVNEGDKKRDLQFSLNALDVKNKHNIITQLYEQKFAEYVISETKSFVEKVEFLVKQTDNFLNIADNY